MKVKFAYFNDLLLQAPDETGIYGSLDLYINPNDFTTKVTVAWLWCTTLYGRSTSPGCMGSHSLIVLAFSSLVYFLAFGVYNLFIFLVLVYSS